MYGSHLGLARERLGGGAKEEEDEDRIGKG